MKINLLLLAAVSLALSASAALPDAINVFGVGATNNAGVQAWAIVSPRSQNGGVAVVTAIDAATDTPNTASVHAYQVTESVLCKFKTNSTVTLSVLSTNTGTKWDTGDVIIRHKSNDQYEKRTLTTSIGETNIVLTAAPLQETVPGDEIYKVVDNNVLGNLTMETNTVAANRMFIRRSLSGAPLFVGQKGKPLMLQVTSTNSTGAFLNNVSGYYAP